MTALRELYNTPSQEEKGYSTDRTRKCGQKSHSFSTDIPLFPTECNQYPAYVLHCTVSIQHWHRAHIPRLDNDSQGFEILLLAGRFFVQGGSTSQHNTHLTRKSKKFELYSFFSSLLFTLLITMGCHACPGGCAGNLAARDS